VLHIAYLQYNKRQKKVGIFKTAVQGRGSVPAPGAKDHSHGPAYRVGDCVDPNEEEKNKSLASA
jgi:hypothetical protein